MASRAAPYRPSVLQPAPCEAVPRSSPPLPASVVQVCWPLGVARCKYDAAAVGCTQTNPKHLCKFSHRLDHVKAVGRKLTWTGPKGVLYRLLADHSLLKVCVCVEASVSQGTRAAASAHLLVEMLNVKSKSQR